MAEEKAARQMSGRFFVRGIITNARKLGMTYLVALTRRPSGVAVALQLEYPSRFRR